MTGEAINTLMETRLPGTFEAEGASHSLTRIRMVDGLPQVIRKGNLGHIKGALVFSRGTHVQVRADACRWVCVRAITGIFM